MKDRYVVLVNKKYFFKLIKYNIYINKVKKIKDNYYLYLDYSNYQKILKFKNIYNIKLIGYQGIIKYKKILKENYLFFIMFLLGITLIIFLSNIIFSIDIKTTDLSIKKLLLNELNKEGISIYKFAKSFTEKEKIKNNILKNNKEQLEWLEISRVGSKYIVNVEKRIINKQDIDNTPQDIVALKNAVILSINATNGNIVKKLNDYVKKGDVIVSGMIMHDDEIVDLIKAKATIYGETWYNVTVSIPLFYYEKTYTGREKNVYTLEIFDKKIRFFDKEIYKQEEVSSKNILNNLILPIKFSKDKIKEVVIIDDLFTVEEAIKKAMELGEKRLLSMIPSDSKILSQKKLKISKNNSTIDVDIFFKVYENITDTKVIVEGE